MYLALHFGPFPVTSSRILQLISTPRLALLFLAAGVLAINLEFLWPGRYVAGAAGLACCLLSLAALAAFPLQTAGLVWFLAAALCFAWQYRRAAAGLPGVCGTLLAAEAAHALIPAGGASLTFLQALGFAVVPGLALTWSLRTASLSRETKRHGINTDSTEHRKSPHNEENRRAGVNETWRR